MRILESNAHDGVFGYHSVVRRGKWWSPDLWLVATRSKGVPFAEYVLSAYRTRPILGFAKTVGVEGSKIHFVSCRLDEKGNEEVSEYEYPVASTENEVELINGMAQSILRDKGKVVGLNEGFDTRLEFWEELDTNESKQVQLAREGEAIDGWRRKARIEWFDRTSLPEGLVTEKGRVIKVPTSPLVKAIGVGMCGAFILLLMTRSEQQAVEMEAKRSEVATQNFAREFSNGYSPRVAMYQLYRTMVKKEGERVERGLRSGAPGWSPSTIQMDSKSITVSMKSSRNAPTSTIRKVVHGLGGGIVVTGQNEVMIVKEWEPDCFVPVLNRPTLIPIEGTVNYVIRALDLYLPNMKLEFGKDTEKDFYAVRDVAIEVKNASEEGLDLLGTVLNNLPIAFSNANFKVEGKFGLLSGQVNVKVIGCSLNKVTSTGMCQED
jgi:hypothetical protein